MCEECRMMRFLNYTHKKKEILELIGKDWMVAFRVTQFTKNRY